MNGSLPVPLLLVGVGNDLRGDDAAGRIVARTVAQWNRPGVRVLERHQLVPELVEDLASAASLIVVDAAVGDSVTLTCELAHPAADFGSVPLTHALSVSHLLAYAWKLHRRCPLANVVRIPANRFDYGAPPSPICQAGIDAALRLLAERLPA
jgi:hydrogenase maturation protease